MKTRQQGRRRRPTAATFATIAAMTVIGALLLGLFVVRLAQNPDVKNQLGDQVFTAGRVTDLVHEITSPAPDGRTGPILLADLLNRSRDIYLQHIGDDPMHGWLAFEAHAPGAPRRCVLSWVQNQSQFRESCDGRLFSADGSGLTHYPTSIDKRSSRLVVDLRHPLPPEPTAVPVPAP